MEALGIIGFLVLAAGIIMLIVSAIRKRRLLTWGIVAIAGLALFITGMSLSEPTTPTPEPLLTPAPATTPTLTPTPTSMPTPTLTPTPEPSGETPSPTSTPTPAPTPTPTPAPAQLVTKDASELVLTITDFEPGWVQQSAKPTSKEGAQSAYHVYFYDGSLLPLSPPVIQNTIAVYPSIEQAKEVYLNEST